MLFDLPTLSIVILTTWINTNTRNYYSMCHQLKSPAICPRCTFADFVLFFGINGNSSPTQHYNFGVCVGDTMCFLRCKKSIVYSKFFNPYCCKDSLLLGRDTVQLCEYSPTFRRLLLPTKRQEMFVPAHVQGQAPWRWRHCDTSKCRKLVVQYHDVTYKKIRFFRHSAFGSVRRNCEKQLIASSCQSVRSHGNRLSPDGFSWKFMFQYFSKIRREYSSFVKMWLE